MSGERRFQDGRWWQWDGERWLLEPEALAPQAPDPDRAEPEAEAPWDGDTSDPEYQAELGRQREAVSSQSRRRTVIVVVAAIVILGLAALGARAWLTKSSALADAYSACELSGKAGASLADGGHTLELDGKGKDDATGLDVVDQACVMVALKAPSSVLSDIDSTRALDGRQQTSWDGITAVWRYHPDNGLELVLTN